MQIRPYQSDMIENIRKSGYKRVLVQMPTGTGKTVVFTNIALLGFAKSSRILIIAHLDYLIEQITDKLASYGIGENEVGLVESDKKIDTSKLIQVAMVKTLRNRIESDDFDFEPSLIIVDEAHHIEADTYQFVLDAFPNAMLLGFTATPHRLDKKGFDKTFDTLICAPQIAWFIENGYLCKVESYVIESELAKELEELDKLLSDGDYDMNVAFRIANKYIADVFENWASYASDKQTIVFAVTIEHSENIKQHFLANNITCEHIDAFTPKKKRRDIIKAFKRKEIQVLTNVGIFTEGFDVPSVQCVLLARPTKSLSLYLQMCGRVMRIEENKPYGIILDCANLNKNFGVCVLDREWHLEGEAKRAYTGGGDKEEKETSEKSERDLIVEFEIFLSKAGEDSDSDILIYYFSLLKKVIFGAKNNGEKYKLTYPYTAIKDKFFLKKISSNQFLVIGRKIKNAHFEQIRKITDQFNAKNAQEGRETYSLDFFDYQKKKLLEHELIIN